VLEGIETDDEMNILEPLEPDLIQGYLFGKPMKAPEALEAAEHLGREANAHNLAMRA
jgi:EAL domain-containing protein (putative c-di-GMP-specific phosphodiesterase class I)